MNELKEERYFKVEKVGEGTYGVVYKAHDTMMKTFVAMKRVRGDMGASEGIPSSALREVSSLMELRHENVVRLMDVLNQPNKLYLVFEFVDQDLKKYLDSLTSPLPADTLRKYQRQLLLGVEYCHGKRVIHRDLKPQNILISSDREQLKIADFGLARDFQYPVQTYTQETVTLWYRAPELLLGATKYTPEIDVWSIGCIFAEMAMRKPLFTGDCAIGALFEIFKLLGTPRSDVWEDVTSLPHHNHSFPSWRRADLSKALPIEPLGVDLFDKMLCYDPGLRITPTQALEHPYFNKIRESRESHVYHTQVTAPRMVQAP
eukprot:TRINITY_DN6114_c0_g1_i3.p1 TRINITY_DN6114_c0_g1~~TRINITY_DN6114_c0_g1_i3.p1  ORF type:complete len:317 (+),score=115.19 TRINITY_DN6114_c0_g1_i3:441-1391(+)